MNITRRTLGTGLAAGLLAGVSPAIVSAQTAPAGASARRAGTAVPPDWRALVAKVTRLSVLTDRMIRSQAQRALSVLAQRGERVLTDSVTEARRLLVEVVEGLNVSGLPASSYQALLREYVDFLAETAALPAQNRPALLQLAGRSDQLGEGLDKLAEAMLKSLNHPLAKVLSTTADLQRLTQDAAVHFLLVRTGLDDKLQQAKVNTKRETFSRLLAELQAFPLRSATIQQLLPLLVNQWTLMNQALDLQSRDTSAMENVCTTSERTLEVLTQLYPAFEAMLKAPA